MAGGFEWEDPTEAFDQAVDNPFKNTDVLVDPQDGMLKIDPARLLAPRMNGSNLYFIGMMGSGKSAVGKIVAKRKWNLDI
jgi:shikimate kinase